jgi:hypothetical protein
LDFVGGNKHFATKLDLIYIYDIIGTESNPKETGKMKETIFGMALASLIIFAIANVFDTEAGELLCAAGLGVACLAALLATAYVAVRRVGVEYTVAMGIIAIIFGGAAYALGSQVTLSF